MNDTTIKIGWILLTIAIICSFGAFILTNIGLSMGFREGNSITAALFGVHPLATLATQILVWILLYITQKRAISRTPKLHPKLQKPAIIIIPAIALLIFGLDFTHDAFMIFTGSSPLTEIMTGLFIYNGFVQNLLREPHYLIH